MNDNIRISELARQVLNMSRNQLLVNLRFLDVALSRFVLFVCEEIPFGTDGRLLFYSPRHILKCYKSEQSVMVRNYLHLLLHAVYRHMFVHTLIDHTIWDLACDIAVEYTINSLGIKATEAEREYKQTAVINELEDKVGRITAERVYRYYLDKGLSASTFHKLQETFYADDHRIWYMTDGEKKQAGISLMGNHSGNTDENIASSGDNEEYHGNSSNDLGEISADNSLSHSLGSEEDWRDISERMQMEMESFSKNQGYDPASMIQNLKEINREKYDYTSFLRRFAVMGEAMKINDDEFDYVYYTYGLSLYKNMPLVEPLEYKEVKRIKEFVIAIDTSGSVAGDTVQRFLQKTWNIMKSTENFFSKVNVHIIQCDADIQEDSKITSQEEFDNYIDHMQIRGLGGTDFRPVFEYVDQLCALKEFSNLKGLIYFTDGWGTYPKKMPDYQTAFVFLDDENNNYEVPPWAIKVILNSDEI